MSQSHGELSQGEASRGQGVVEDEHKIFLSHSGAQKAFVMQLNEDFKACDRYPFFDMERYSLPIGERFPPHIFQAIQQCDVGLVVLSEDFFTRSHWPMTEMVEMVKCKKRIVPIFLGVSPEGLKNEDTLACWISQWEAWKKPNCRIDIVEWKEALEELRKISGLVYKHGKGVVKFRREIVRVVNEIVPACSRWDDSHVEGRLALCKAIQDKVLAVEGGSIGRPQVVGLYGVGGIGKTTACKCMINEFFAEFDGRVCYIEFNIKSTCKERVQEVLRRFTNSNREVLKSMSEDECNNRFKKMQFGKVFLAIDNVSSDANVEEEEVLNYLRANYGHGSIVLVAAQSLNKLLELKINVDCCLAMPELKKTEAIALFLKHVALPVDIANNLDAKLVFRCVQRCYYDKGDRSGAFHYHPLALKVSGIQLGKRDPKEWASLIKDNVVFNVSGKAEHPIFSILRSSFDALPAEDQALFMDVALFDVDYLIHQEWMVGRNVFGRHGKLSFFSWLVGAHDGFNSNNNGMRKLESLKRNSLLEEIGDGKSPMGMHDLWREFALKETERGLVRKRRWVYEIVGGKALDSILSGGGWKKLQRICLIGETAFGTIHPSVKCLNFSKCENVTVLRMVGVGVEDDAVLDLSPLIQLKVLEIPFDRRAPVRVRGFGKLKNLRILVWVKIEAESFGALEEISHLRNLRVLHLVTTASDLSATLDLSELRWLEYLRLEFNNRNAVTVSGLSSKMANLRIVDFCRSEGLRSCLGVGDVTNLDFLSLRGCVDLELLHDLQKLSKLRILDVSLCKSMKTIEGLGNLTALEELCATHCKKLNGVPDLSRLTNLRRLDLWRSEQVHHIPGLSNLIALQELRACSEILDTWPEHQKLTNLQSVEICSWDGMGESQRDLDLAVLESIVSLQVWVVDRELSNLKKLSNLQRLEIYDCSLKTLHGLNDLSALKTLQLQFSSLESLPDMGQLTSLESLFIWGCKKLTGLTSSGPLPALESLLIYRSEALVVWPGVSLLPGLRILELGGCGVKLNVSEVEVLKARCHRLQVSKSSLDFDSDDIYLWRESEVAFNANEALPDVQLQECLDPPPSCSDPSQAQHNDFLPYNEPGEEFGVSRKHKSRRKRKRKRK